MYNCWSGNAKALQKFARALQSRFVDGAKIFGASVDGQENNVVLVATRVETEEESITRIFKRTGFDFETNFRFSDISRIRVLPFSHFLGDS